MLTRVALDSLLLTSLLVALGLVGAQRIARRRLHRFTRRQVGNRAGRDAAFELASVLSVLVKEGEDPYFIAPVFGSLGAAPSAVLEQGGCCSGIHRLFITALDTIGIPAAQITLYHRNGQARHCLVEVRLQSTPVIVDVSYGVYYRTADGRPIGLEDLQNGVSPCFLQLPDHAGRGYPKDDYYDFNFRLSRTANWTKSTPRRAAYWILNHLSAGRVDRLRLPPLLEWPHILMALLILPVLVAFYVARAWVP